MKTDDDKNVWKGTRRGRFISDSRRLVFDSSAVYKTKQSSIYSFNCEVSGLFSSLRSSNKTQRNNTAKKLNNGAQKST